MKEVDRGYRLPPPPGCPKAMYELMIQCWWVSVDIATSNDNSANVCKYSQTRHTGLQGTDCPSTHFFLLTYNAGTLRRQGVLRLLESSRSSLSQTYISCSGVRRTKLFTRKHPYWGLSLRQPQTSTQNCSKVTSSTKTMRHLIEYLNHFELCMLIKTFIFSNCVLPSA